MEKKDIKDTCDEKNPLKQKIAQMKTDMKINSLKALIVQYRKIITEYRMFIRQLKFDIKRHQHTIEKLEAKDGN